MLVLDTDHLTAMGYDSPVGQSLIRRLDESGEEIATTAISVDEQLTGLLAAIHHRHDPSAQVEPYAELVERMGFLSSFLILPWDEDAVMRFRELKSGRIKGGTMDLKSRALCSRMMRRCSPAMSQTSPLCPVSDLKTGWT